jgi:hypothetical protein
MSECDRIVLLAELDNIVLTLRHLEQDVRVMRDVVIKIRLRQTVGQDTLLSDLHPDLQDLYFDADVGGLDN